MESLTSFTQFPSKPKCLMTFKFPSPLFFRNAAFFRFSAAFSTEPAILEPKTRPTRVKKVNVDTVQLKKDWLESLSGASLENSNKVGIFDANSIKVETFDANSDKVGTLDANSSWVFGIDPDLSGALAVLKPDNSAQVYDAPILKVLVGSRIRKRLDAKSITQLLQTIDAPVGTTAYIEQSIPFPQDGKQGWWSGGFGYGLWIGILVASGYNVVPVPSMLWKNEFKLAGSRTSKDDSREFASTLFPTMCSLLKRKKDHGRAEALLIAGYGKGLKAKFSPCVVEEDEEVNNLPNLPQKQDLQVACTSQA